MILLGFTQAESDQSAPERQVKIRMEWIGGLRQHDLFGTIIERAYVGDVWVRETLAEVEAEMMTEHNKMQHAIGRQSWQNGRA